MSSSSVCPPSVKSAMYMCSAAAAAAAETGAGSLVGAILFRPAAQTSAVADWATVPAVVVWYMDSLPTVMMSLMAFVQVAGRSCRRHP